MSKIIIAVLLELLILGSQRSMEQQQVSMKRTACLILSRYHSYSKNSEIQNSILDIPPSQQQAYIDVMFANAVIYCLSNISVDEAQKFFIEDQQFSVKQLYYIMDDYIYTENVNYKQVIEQQKQMITFMKQFDAKMKKREDREEL